MASNFNDVDQNNLDLKIFMSLLGKLIFIIKTCPDVAYDVNKMATRAVKHIMKDYYALLRIVRYLVATAGYTFCLGDPHNTMFYLRTMKQSNVTLSSTESENAAAVKAAKDILWFRQLLTELGFNQFHPTIVFASHLPSGLFTM
jgi:hypothetical protein